VRRSVVGLLLLAVGCFLAASESASAQGPPTQSPPTQGPPTRPRFRAIKDDKQFLHLAVSFREIVDSATTKKLKSGLPTTLVTSVGVFRAGEAKPATWMAHTCVVTYDLWDELYHVKLDRGTDEIVVLSLEGIFRHCADYEILSPPGALAPGSYYVQANAFVNPVSPDMIERVKRWVSRPVGTNVAAGDALFGSFVDLFVTRGIGDADAKLDFREFFTLTP